MSSGGSFWSMPSLGKGLRRWSSGWCSPSLPSRVLPWPLTPAQKLRHIALPAQGGAAELVVQPQQQIQEAVEPRAAIGLAPYQLLQRTQPLLHSCGWSPATRARARPPACLVRPSVRPSGGPSVAPRLALRGFPPPSRPPRCHLPPSPPALPHLAARPALQARPRRTGRCAPANGSRD